MENPSPPDTIPRTEQAAIVRTEIADRLAAIGILGQRVREDRIDPRLAVTTAVDELARCLMHLDSGG